MTSKAVKTKTSKASTLTSPALHAILAHVLLAVIAGIAYYQPGLKLPATARDVIPAVCAAAIAGLAAVYAKSPAWLQRDLTTFVSEADTDVDTAAPAISAAIPANDRPALASLKTQVDSLKAQLETMT
jgi:hypothetical protein